MAVFATTADPRGLARRVMDAVKNGTVAAWELTSGHLRHVDSRAADDRKVAFFKMTVSSGALKFVLVGAKRSPPFDGPTYAFHHGRLTELLLGHFSDAVTRVQSTPFPGLS